MKLKAFIVCFMFSAAGVVNAADPNSYESGICIFNLYDCELTAPVERAILFGVSQIFDTYKKSFGFDYPDDYKIKVTIFADKDKFTEYQKKQGKNRISELAYYSVRFKEAVVYWKTYSKRTEDAKFMVSCVYHEVNHMLLMAEVPWIPLWINEGLSEYFDGLNVFGQNRRVYLHEHHQRWLKRWAEKGFPVNLDEYLGLNRSQWHELNRKIKHCNAGYTIGYSLVYFMMSRSSTEEVLKELLWEFKRKGKDADSIKIINEHYPGGLEKLERNWLSWIPRARSYRPLRVLREEAEKAKEGSPVEEPDEN
ncbi:MAG: hypothetical protein WC476_08415 [Phycisphaerae bacterium]|jgi:hypothetical protein